MIRRFVNLVAENCKTGMYSLHRLEASKLQIAQGRDPRIRRFLNLVAENSKTGMYSLHRLEASKHLFHQSRADARVVPFLAEAQDNSSAARDERPTFDMLEELPEPCVKIYPSFREEPALDKLPLWEMLSPRSSEDKFLCINWLGDTMLCDANKPSVDPMPHLQDLVGLHPISFPVARPDAQDQKEEDLYVIHNGANTTCFRVFRKDASGWRWESLPPPPFVGAPHYDPTRFMSSYTVVDEGRTICLSCATPGIGTYCFNTVEREWRYAGNWLLPFVGRAEYVPDLALWLGFSPCNSSYYLCGTSDLKAMSVDHPPKLQYVWHDLATPENWSAGWTQLVSLGSGRFCIAKAFGIENRRTGESGDEWWELEDEVTVLTGIEVARDDNELKLWRHKSLQYSSKYNVKWFL